MACYCNFVKKTCVTLILYNILLDIIILYSKLHEPDMILVLFENIASFIIMVIYFYKFNLHIYNNTNKNSLCFYFYSDVIIL